MQLTTLMSLIGALTMIASWAFVAHRRQHSRTASNEQVTYLETFFLMMGIFSFIIFLPHLLIEARPDLFPRTMAWAYTFGHIFLYIALLQILMLTCSMVPALARWKTPAVVVAGSYAVFILIVNYFTMVRGVMPRHDPVRHVTFFNATPLVGNSIAALAAICVLPAAVLMIYNGITNPTSRVRSLLLGGGLFLIMTAGPLHDTAKTWQLYTAADVISLIGMIVLATGVVYRLEERLGRAPTTTQPATGQA